MSYGAAGEIALPKRLVAFHKNVVFRTLHDLKEESRKIAVVKYAGAANGTSWQILRNFLNGNSQFESNHPLIIPRLPPNILVKKSILKEPVISSLPVMPRENFPLIIRFSPSIVKLINGKRITAAINNADKSISLN